MKLPDRQTLRITASRRGFILVTKNAYSNQVLTSIAPATLPSNHSQKNQWLKKNHKKKKAKSPAA
jgi:hypothetical protein